jgi:prolyl oligopeptidase
MFVFYKKGLQLNGKNPTQLTGYGGSMSAIRQSFAATALHGWTRRGVCRCQPAGGAEFGEAWHRAGMLDKNKMFSTYFIAAAEYLIEQKYTDKEHLAIRGGSNGGLLMGAVLTQRPDLVSGRCMPGTAARHAAISELSNRRSSGFRIWVVGRSETVRLAVRVFPRITMSRNTEYPAILFMTADTDTRVDRCMRRKWLP